MSERSDFILGKDVFIKVVSLNRDKGTRLAKALVTQGEMPPFTANEFLFNYLVTRSNKPLIDNLSISQKQNSLLSPKTLVLVSGTSYSLSDFDKYKETSYEDTLKDLREKFSEMERYLRSVRNLAQEGRYIKTALIISRRVTGNYDEFLKKYSESPDYNKLFTDSLIHISYLFHHLQENYQAVHGDPKTQNYTWLELEEPINIIYDFRNKYDNSDNRIVRRKNVKHLFYLADLEFVFSPILKTVTIDNNTYYFDFFIQAAWYGEDLNDDRVYVPKISKDPPYELNFQLYGGYQYEPNQDLPKLPTLYDFFEPIFPRMFTIDLLTLVKMLLTYWYADTLNVSNLRKLNIYFTQFVSLSFIEKNPHRRNQGDYEQVSPGSFAHLLNSR